jgi:glycosyltransferase involved in cell wall biosynthesis
VVKKKTICISIPCYNEVENVVPLCEAVLSVFSKSLSNYNCIVQFIDNCSSDGTQEAIEDLCNTHPNVRAIFNRKNYYGNSAMYGLLQTSGDAAIYLSADFQDPIDRIPELVKFWEKGYTIVAGIKKTSKENRIMRVLRTWFYKIMRTWSSTKFIEHFCNFGLYDKEFLDLLRSLNVLDYSIRGSVAEYGYNIYLLEYDQQKRRAGISHYKFFDLINLSINNFVHYSGVIPRFAVILGAAIIALFLVCIIITAIVKITQWHTVQVGFLLCVFFIMLGVGVNIFVTGIVGEYILATRKDVRGNQLVFERTRINFSNYNE